MKAGLLGSHVQLFVPVPSWILCPSLCPGQFMHTKCLWLWEFSRSPTFRVHTWRACSPSLSESWLAGQPRAALCSSTFVNSLPISLPGSIYAHEMSVTLRVLKVTDISCAYMTCMFAIAKWKLACWAATCSSLFQYFALTTLLAAWKTVIISCSSIAIAFAHLSARVNLCTRNVCDFESSQGHRHFVCIHDVHVRHR